MMNLRFFLSLAIFLCSALVAVGQVQVPTEKDTVRRDTIKIKREGGLAVKGVVVSASNQQGLGGINLGVSGYSAAITDDRGRFSLNIPNASSVVLVSGEGFQNKYVPVRGNVLLTIPLWESGFRSVFDRIVTPLGELAYSQSTQSVGSIDAGGGWSRLKETPESFLQGRISGLNVIRRSGTPFIGGDVVIRGYTSLFTTHQPLYVVDGIIYDNFSYGESLITSHISNPLSDIDLKDIENITVIKDASSTYGTRAAGGVVLITTNQPKELSTRIDFSSYTGMNFVPKKIPLLTSGDYRLLLSDVLQSKGLTNVQVQNLPYFATDPASPNFFRYHQETDWQKQVLKGSSDQQYRVRVTGGDNIARYGLSIGYLKQQGVALGTQAVQYLTRFNAALNFTKKFTGQASLAFTDNEQKLANQGNYPQINPLYLALIKAPIFSPNLIGLDGTLSPALADVDTLSTGNPAAAARKILAFNRNYRFFGSIGFKYQISPALYAQTLTGVTYDKVKEQTFIPQIGIVADTLENAVAKNRSGSLAKRLFSVYNETKIGYQKLITQDQLVAVNVGFRFNSSKSEITAGQGFNSATDDFVGIVNGASTLRRVSGGLGSWNWLNNFASVDYRLFERYIISANASLDASSRFGKEAPNSVAINGNKYALMPSISGAWIVSSEKFARNFRFIDFLKIRASIGKVGNDDIGNYSSQSYYTSQNLLGAEGLVRGNIANPALSWENVIKKNAGFDVSLFHERFAVTADFFTTNTKNLLIQETPLAASGFASVLTNGGSLKTTGYDISIRTRILGGPLKWDAGLNLSHFLSRATRLPDGTVFTDYTGATYVTREGQPLNQFFGFQTGGVYRSDAEAASEGLLNRLSNGTLVPFKGGDVRFVDFNGDKIIDQSDRNPIGSPDPTLTGALNQTFTYKRWTFDALVYFCSGNKVYNQVRNSIESLSSYSNQSIAALSRWKGDGQLTNVPRASWGDPGGNARFSDRWIEDGSYLRLRTASISYDVPVKAGLVKYARLYFTANNLFTLTRYLGYDPEFSASSNLPGRGVDNGLEPQYKSIQIGLRLGL